MTKKIDRSYLEIKSIEDLIESNFHELHLFINLKPTIFKLINFFIKVLAKNIDGKTVLLGQKMNGLNIPLVTK